jgi:non-specific serine/threonine protein kinase/serine/threonine-protein kinase
MHNMTPAHWQHVRGIVYAASQLETSRRARYLAEQCGGDRALREEVEDLLEALEKSSGFLESSLIPDTPPAESVDQPPSQHIGRRVGVYLLLEEIGRGGMGEVYRAIRVDGQFEQQVAVKLVRGGWDAEFILERFRQERQVLARLEHRNIARLLDGGTTPDGIPYLVMELIEGTPIDQYCRQRDLGIDARLQLFQDVCAAVHYAHQRLVIHRDIKPGNILVAADGVPKLLDFGIAKIVDPAGGSGATMLLPMTPEYASPEQLCAEPVTTASDVYSLGVVLYVLLTGRLPYGVDRRNMAGMVRAATDSEPERPSDALVRGAAGDQVTPLLAKTRRRLRGDLDTILLKALRKEPQHRYSSVEQFSEDIRREMRGLPVTARRGSWNYRAGKFFRRHKLGVLLAAVTLLAVLGGIAATVREARIAAANAQRAEKRFNDVRALATSNLFELNDALEKLPASAPARHLLIQRALEYLDKLRVENSGDRELMREMALAYQRIAELQGRFKGAGVGDVNSSVASYRNALALRSRLVEISRHDPDEVLGELHALGDYIRSLLLAGRLQEAAQTARSGLDLSQALLNRKPQDPRAHLAYGNTSLILAWILGGNGSGPNTRQVDEAIAHDRAAIQALEQSSAQDATIRQRLVNMRTLLASHYWRARAFEKSLEELNQILSKETLESIGPVPILRVYNWRGHIFVSRGDHQSAFKDYQRGLQLARAVAAKDPDDMDAMLDRDILAGLSAIEEARLGRPQRALIGINAALTSIEQMFASNPEPFYQRILLVGYSFRGEILSQLGHQTAARANLSRSLSIAEDFAKKDADDLDSLLQMGRVHAALGVLWARSSRFDNARRELSGSIALARQLQAARPRDAEAKYLAESTEKQLSALERCASTAPCTAAAQLQLPSLIE